MGVLYKEPGMTCDKCGLAKRVEKDPQLTRNWFKRYHKECGGKPVYACGFGPFTTKLTGQNDKSR